jgi:beta-lactamase class A
VRERLLGAAVVALLVVGVLGVAVGDGGDDEGATVSVELDEGPVRERVAWVLQLINDGSNAAEIPAVFASTFLEAVPEAQVLALVEGQLRPAGPFAIEEIVSQRDRTASLVVRGPTGTALTMQIAVARGAPHAITGLVFQPYRGDVPKASTWDELDEQLRDAAPTVAFLAAEIVDGECRAVHEVDADRVSPLGSAFKLYVLGAAAEAVVAGRVSWDDTLVVTDERRVHSSATYGTAAAGTEVSLRDAATAMISVSDNTATDLVMTHVGREAIEAHQGALGMDDPGRNIPFLTTRELTMLKWIVPAAEREAYIAADVDERRRLIDALPDRGAVESDLAAVSGPVALEDLEWYASPADLCRAHIGLQDAGEDVRRILAVNPGQGLDFDRERWPYLGFKGGSEPGVLALSWLAERSDGRRFFVGALLRNDDAHVTTAVAQDVVAAFDLLAVE